MDILLKGGRAIFAVGMTGLGFLCLTFQDFIVGRPPAWPTGWNINPTLAFISGALMLLASAAILLKKKGALAALIIALLIFVFSVLRHFPQFLDWVNTFKTLALLGGALIMASAFYHEGAGYITTNVINKKNLLLVGSFFMAAFFIAAGYAHFKWAEGVQFLIPEFIPWRLFWTYFCGICLFAGGIGILIPATRQLAALLSGIMVLGWFLLLHIPRVIANPADPSDRLGLFESFTIAGVFFVMTRLFAAYKKSAT